MKPYRQPSIDEQLEQEIADLQWEIDNQIRYAAAITASQKRLSAVIDYLLGPGSSSRIINGQTTPGTTNEVQTIIAEKGAP